MTAARETPLGRPLPIRAAFRFRYGELNRTGETAMTRSLGLLAALLAGLAAAPDSALAQSRVSVGVLECRAGSATSFIVGSVRDFDCLFTPTNGPLQRYGATIQRLGVDLGWSTSTVLVWSVFAPTEVVGPGALTGGYGGVSAGAAVGGGVRAHAPTRGLDKPNPPPPPSVEGPTRAPALVRAARPDGPPPR